MTFLLPKQPDRRPQAIHSRRLLARYGIVRRLPKKRLRRRRKEDKLDMKSLFLYAMEITMATSLAAFCIYSFIR